MVMQMLALTKQLNEAMAVALEAGDWGQPSQRTDEDTFAYNWSKRKNVGGVYQQTVGILGFGEIGFRNITNNVRPVVVPADLEGLKLRAPQPVPG